MRLRTAVQAGSVLEWIDKAGYACAVGWAASTCVTAYVGNVDLDRPIASGDLVEASAGHRRWYLGQIQKGVSGLL